jgi:hypothetical protein
MPPVASLVAAAAVWQLQRYFGDIAVASAAAAERQELRCCPALPQWWQRHWQQQQCRGHRQQSPINWKRQLQWQLKWQQWQQLKRRQRWRRQLGGSAALAAAAAWRQQQQCISSAVASGNVTVKHVGGGSNMAGAQTTITNQLNAAAAMAMMTKQLKCRWQHWRWQFGGSTAAAAAAAAAARQSWRQCGGTTIATVTTPATSTYSRYLSTTNAYSRYVLKYAHFFFEVHI